MKPGSFVPFLLAGLLFFTSCSRKESMESRLILLISRYAPTAITADTSMLSAGNRAALHELIAAAKIMDSLYLRQVWSGNIRTLETLTADKSPEGQGKRETQEGGVLHRPDHSDGVLREGCVRAAEGLEPSMPKVGIGAHIVDDLAIDRAVVQGVDREVPTLGVLLHRAEEVVRVGMRRLVCRGRLDP